MSHSTMKNFASSAAWMKIWMSLINEWPILSIAPFDAVLTEDSFTDGTSFPLAIFEKDKPRIAWKRRKYEVSWQGVLLSDSQVDYAYYCPKVQHLPIVVTRFLVILSNGAWWPSAPMLIRVVLFSIAALISLSVHGRPVFVGHPPVACSSNNCPARVKRCPPYRAYRTTVVQ